jgi:hypothetical protein
MVALDEILDRVDVLLWWQKMAKSSKQASFFSGK